MNETHSDAIVSIDIDGKKTIYRCKVNNNLCGTEQENLSFMSIGFANRVWDIDAYEFPVLKPENIPLSQHHYFIF
jgi:hypothetical protein